MTYKQVYKCRCCQSENLQEYLDLGEQPLANAFYDGKEQQSRYPLKVNVCLNCFHNQLSIAVDSVILYKNYPYVTGISQSFRTHCQSLVQDVKDKLSTSVIHPKVLDIGCNDGTLLNCFRQEYPDCRAVGVDPCVTSEDGVHLISGFWGKSLACSIGEKFDVITSTNSFAHVDDNEDFLKACALVLAKDGLVVIEVPYHKNLITHLQFDTIYHEHLSYWLVAPFIWLVDRCGFSIVDVVLTPIHGGSLRIWLKKERSLFHHPLVHQMVTWEYDCSLFSFDRYERFAIEVKGLKNQIEKIIGKKGKIGYGACAKATVMLNYCDVDLDYVVDDTPQKQGKFIPGTEIPVLSPEILKNENPGQEIVILPWNFQNEIINKIRHIRTPKQKDCYIVYQPEVKRYPLFGND